MSPKLACTIGPGDWSEMNRKISLGVTELFADPHLLLTAKMFLVIPPGVAEIWLMAMSVDAEISHSAKKQRNVGHITHSS